MESLALTWAAAVVVFLILEMFTITFYGLAIALSCGVVALYVTLTGETDFSLMQGGVFAVSALVFSLILPRFLSRRTPDIAQ